MEVACFYHCWSSGAWEASVVDQLAALEAAGFDGPAHLGLVGRADECDRVLRLWRGFGRPATVAATAESGHERCTINAVRAYALEHDGAVMYAHSKGAWGQTELHVGWRRTMTHHVVGRWRQNRALLEEGAQAVGCYWLNAMEYRRHGVGAPIALSSGAFFGGNFWMARCDYLRQLPICPNESRYDAETWIGLGNPRVVNLLPGLPG